MSKAVVTRAEKRKTAPRESARSGGTPYASQSRRVSQRQIRQVANRLVQELQPEKIILFGSYAYGKPGADSDVDMLVVMETKERIARRETLVLRALEGVKRFPMDILVRTPRELAFRIAIGDSFINEVLARGKILYERSVA